MEHGQQQDAEVEQFESRDSLSKAEIRLSELNGSLAKAEEHESHARDALARHEDCAPGLWHTLTTLGKARALWRSDREGLVTNLDIARSWVTQWRDQYSQLERLILDLRVSGARLNLRVGAATAHASKLRTLRAELESDLGRAMNQLGGAWLDVDMDQEQREHVTPWGEPRWLAAREEVFLAALDLHRAFFEAHPVQMAANLAIACDWLAGKRVDGILVAPALESLCLVVPVVSATLASFPRMFAKAPRESIGYVLVDEGGQAQAAHVACAVWRARRTVSRGRVCRQTRVGSSGRSAYRVHERRTGWPDAASRQTGPLQMFLSICQKAQPLASGAFLTSRRRGTR